MTAKLQLPNPTALVLIDMQRAVDDPSWTAVGPRNNPGAESAAATLLARWRELGWPIAHVRHDSTEPNSTFRPERPGNAFKPEITPKPGELIFPKQVNSAFIGTDLERHLRDIGALTLVILGVATNNSLEATVRMAGNLGFSVHVPEDACFTFARRDLGGRLWSAEDIHALSLANMHGEYASVSSSKDILATLR